MEFSFIKKNLSVLKDLQDSTPEKTLSVFSNFVKGAYESLSSLNIRAVDERDYLSFKAYIDDLSYFIRHSKIKEEDKFYLHNQIGVIKLGARIPLDFLQKTSNLRDFIRVNGLENIFWTLKQTLGYDEVHGVALPVETKELETTWYFFKELTWETTEEGYKVSIRGKILFETDPYMIFSREYCMLWSGITHYDRRKSTNFRPYKYQDPSIYGNKHQLEIMVTWRKGEEFSYLAATHVSMELKSANGEVRSVGQDIYDHIRAVPMRGFFRATSRCSIVKTPDEASFYPKHHRATKWITIPLTKKEHDKIIEIVQEDKGDCNHVAALLKGNCVSYTCTILKRVLDYNVISDVCAHEILLREFLPNKLDKLVQKVLAKTCLFPPYIQRALFYIPPLSLIIGAIGLWSFFSSYYGHNHHQEYPLWKYLLKPWSIRCDIPKFFFDVLDRYTDEHGVISRSSYPSGSIFD